jgi:hypothetical protein
VSVTKNHSDVGMTQKLANGIEIHTGLNQAAGKMMAIIPPAELEA